MLKTCFFLCKVCMRFIVYTVVQRFQMHFLVDCKHSVSQPHASRLWSALLW